MLLKVWQGRIVRFDPVSFSFQHIGDGVDAMAVARSEHTAVLIDDKETC